MLNMKNRIKNMVYKLAQCKFNSLRNHLAEYRQTFVEQKNTLEQLRQERLDLVLYVSDGYIDYIDHMINKIDTFLYKTKCITSVLEEDNNVLDYEDFASGTYLNSIKKMIKEINLHIEHIKSLYRFEAKEQFVCGLIDRLSRKTK